MVMSVSEREAEALARAVLTTCAPDDVRFVAVRRQASRYLDLLATVRHELAAAQDQACRELVQAEREWKAEHGTG